MAYVNTDLLEDKNDPTEAGGPLVPGGGATSSAPSAPNAPSAPQGAKQKTPSNFADLSEYLRVNSPQEFGSQVAGKVGEDISKGEQSLSNATSEFKNRADASTVTDNQGLIDQVSTSPETIDKSAFTGLRDAQYQGPQNFSDAQDLYSQATGTAGAAVGKANASKTEGGRFALLDNYFGRPDYSRGQKALDNLLVQNDDNSKQAFAQMQQNANQLQQNVESTGSDLNQYGAGAKAKTESTRAAARGALGIDDAGNVIPGAGAIGKLQGETQAQYDSRVAQQKTDEAAIRDALATKDFSKLTPEQKQILGTQDSSIDSYYRVDPAQYLSKADLNLQNTATTEEQQRADALAGLAGVDNTYLPKTDDTGKYASAPGVGYDFSGLTNAIKSGQQQYQSQLDTALTATPFKANGDQTYANSALRNMFTTYLDQNLQPNFQTGEFSGPKTAQDGINKAIQNVSALKNQGKIQPDAYQEAMNQFLPAKQRADDAVQKAQYDVGSYWGVNNGASRGVDTSGRRI